MMMQSILPECLSSILLGSNAFFANNYSHLSLLKGSGNFGYNDHDEQEQQRELLVGVTDDEEVYDEYIPTTVDTGWMFFIIAVVISVASIVFLPVTIKLGKYFSQKTNSREEEEDEDGGGNNNASEVFEQALTPYSASSADHHSSPQPPKSFCQKIQSLHSKVFLCIADYLIYRWSRTGGGGYGNKHGRREQRNARARAREARESMARHNNYHAGGVMRIVVEDSTAAAGVNNIMGNDSRDEMMKGIELSVRRMTSPVPFNALDSNAQIELYQSGGGGGGNSNNNDKEMSSCCSSSCTSSIQRTGKFLMSIIRYDNETKRLLRLAIPFTFTAIIYTCADLIVLGFISQYLGTDAMVAYALVDLTVGTSSAFLGGFVEAVSSLGSMAYGAKNYFAAGQYVQLAMIFYVLCQIPFFIVWGRFMKDIIVFFGFDETTAEMASKYVWVVLPLDVIGGIHESIGDFLEVIEYEAYTNIFGCVACIIEVVLVWVGLQFYDADLVFVGLIMLGNGVFFLLLDIMLLMWFGWLEKFEGGLFGSLALKNRPLLKEFLKTSAPLMVGSMLAYAEWELLTVFAALLGPAEAATWAVLGFVWDVFESTTEAFGDAGEVRVSYQLGKGRPQLARLSSYKCMFAGLAMSIVMSTIFLSLTNVLPEFLTLDETIQGMLRMLFPLIALGNVTMSVGMVCWALVGAQLRYPLATAIASLCSFGITLPLGAIFTVVLNYDLKGLTFSVIAGYTMTAMLLSTVLLMSDWEKLSERIREKVLADDTEGSSDDDSSNSSSSSSSSSSEEGGLLDTKDAFADLAIAGEEISDIKAKTSEETDVSSVDAIHKAVQEDPNVTSPDRIINKVVTWWG